MRARIARHAEERGREFRTIEEPLDVAGSLASLRGDDVAVVDCLTLWLSNRLALGEDARRVEIEVARLVETISKCPLAAVVLVTNEVGLGIVPENAMGRLFRDVAGRAHQQLAAAASEIYVALMGCIVRLRPPPVALEEAC
jgi:adenosylcobinamide kinase/adenosylcobinamide-phosphate guanylyltransferase